MIDLKKKKHLFFDMDNTLTRSRTPIEKETRDLLEGIPHDIIIVSGQSSESILKQAEGVTAHVMGGNGNHAIHKDGTELWHETLTPAESAEILEHIAKLMRAVNLEVKDPDDLIEHRGIQLCYSLIGHHENVSKKESCDPDKTLRQNLLKEFPFESESLEVKIGGTTTFDYFKKGRHKGYNVAQLIEHFGWNKDDAVYIGDGLFPGGNDEVVVGVIDTVAVDDYRHTHTLLKDAVTRLG